MKHLSLGNESIAFQDGSFFKNLTLIIQDLHESGDRTPEKVDNYLSRIDSCIYESTRILTLTQLWKGTDNAMVLIPSLTKGHVLYGPSFSKWVSDNFDADKNSFSNAQKNGWVDPKSSRVGGAYSEVMHRIYIGTNVLLDKRYTAEEVASMFVHETGHAFTFLQFLSDTVMVNHVLQRSYQELTSSNANVPVRTILDKSAKDLGIEDNTWLQDISNDTDKEVAFKLLVTAVSIDKRGMDNKRFFTQDASEELADIFAARHGAAKAIVTMRSKLGPGSQKEIASLRLATTYAAFTALSILISPPFVILFGLLTMVSVWFSFDTAADIRDETSFKQSATKMRNQLVEQIKQSKLPKEEVQAILQSIVTIDQAIDANRISPASIPVIVRFVDMFRRGKMDARSSRDYTDKLEVLVSNELFVRAAQFAR